MNARQTTERYYARWLGAEENVFRGGDAIRFLRTEERDRVQPGYGRRFDLWALAAPGRIFVSYGEAARGGIDALRGCLRPDDSPEAAAQKIAEVFGAEPERGVKFVLDRARTDIPGARLLGPEDYPAFEAFFRTNNPGMDGDLSWLKEYYDEMCGEGLCCGVFADGLLVSCTDAPTVPYMREAVREIGINTRAEYRGRGCALAACSLALGEILRRGLCPLWSADIGNAASRRLAARLGFVPFAESIALTLPESRR